jgi:hypothetical protein
MLMPEVNAHRLFLPEILIHKISFPSQLHKIVTQISGIVQRLFPDKEQLREYGV